MIEKFLLSHPEWLPYADLVVVPPDAAETVEEFPEASGSDLLHDPGAMSTYGVTKLALYVRLRREGQAHRFAEMVAAQHAPSCNTDDTFFAGLPRLAEQMPERQLNTLLANAKKHGYTPPADAVYQSGLARFPGDPEAFVTRSMGRGYIKRLCEKRGWACDGAVKVKAREPDSDPLADDKCVPLADDLVRSNAAKMIKKNPDLGRLTKAEMRKRVIQKYGPSS